MSVQKRIDWEETAKRAEEMTDNQLHYALVDIGKTLPAADALDREFGKDDGGFYRDQASVYRTEQNRRMGRATTPILV